ALGAHGAQELATGGDVEEEITHFDDRPGRATARGKLYRPSALDAHLGAFVVARAARAQDKPAHGRDARKGLAAETEAPDAPQIVDALDLARRMPQDGRRSILAAHAAAIVGDTHELGAAAFDVDTDAPRSSVDGVFDELLD